METTLVAHHIDGWVTDKWSADKDDRIAAAADSVRVAIFGDWINRCHDVVKSYRTDFYRDAQILMRDISLTLVENMTPERPVNLWASADAYGTHVSLISDTTTRNTVRVRYEVRCEDRHYTDSPIPWTHRYFNVNAIIED